MKSIKRALRRHHRQRMIWHAFRALDWERNPAQRYRLAVRGHNHLARCGCCLCRNPRSLTGAPTLQEQRLLCRAYLELDDPAVLPPGLTRRVCRYRR